MTKADLIDQMVSIPNDAPIAMNIGFQADNISIIEIPEDNYKSADVRGWKSHDFALFMGDQQKDLFAA